jgi:TonB family protein
LTHTSAPSSDPVNLGFGRYVVRSLVGEGSMARVYRAYDPRAEREVALKVLRTEMSWRSGPSGRVRFLREAEAAGRLSHPHIVTIYDVDEDYIVMEFLDGVCLEQLLGHRAALPVAEAMDILHPLAAALDYAHARGIVHRDVKPANVVVLPDGRPKLTDFGVAHLQSAAITSPGEFLGSPSYMSPEQVDGHAVSPRSDVFSLAAVAYEMLTGLRAFGAHNIPATLHAVLHTMPAPLAELRPDLPAHFDEVFARALAKEPEERFGSPGAFAAALDPEGNARALGYIARGTAGPRPAFAGRDAAPPEAALAALETRDLGLQPMAWRSRLPPAVPAASVPPGRRRRVPRGLPLVIAAGILAVVASWMGRSPAVPAPSRPAAPVFALRTYPSDASVWLDDKPVGASPVAAHPLPPGPHSIRVDRAGYAPVRWHFRSTASATYRLTLHERAAVAVRPAGISLSVTRPDAAIESAQETDDMGVASRRVRLAASDGLLPPRRLGGDRPFYPAEAVRDGVQGTVIVDMTVRTDGTTSGFDVVESAGDLLDRAVVDAVKTWRFLPAVNDGAPVPVRWRVQQRFELRP